MDEYPKKMRRTDGEVVTVLAEVARLSAALDVAREALATVAGITVTTGGTPLVSMQRPDHAVAFGIAKATASDALARIDKEAHDA